MKQTDYGIFLHRIPYSESSLIVSFYTLEGGIQKFIFQGAKKKNALLFPLNICELTFYRRQDSELGKLTHSQPAHALDGIFSNPLKGTIAFFMADVLKQTLRTNQAEPEVYAFLEQKILELNETTDVKLFPLRFLAAYTEWIGIAPHIEDGAKYFSLAEGEFHSDFRPGELGIEGELSQALYELFEGQAEIRQRKALLNTLLEYYRMHTPGFNVQQSLEIVTAVLND